MATTPEQKVLRAGAIVAGKYRIERAVARGGFSIVYRGTHIEMQRPVALKILRLTDTVNASWLERFTREARLASQLTHPNTVTIFDYGQDPRGMLYIAMQWVEGISLYQHLKQHGALGPPAVARLALRILGSLQEAHQYGILHRDLKPSNVMLTRDYQGREAIKVLDFGIAKNLLEASDSDTRITRLGAFVGTPRYASPEQFEKKQNLTPASDIYSLGLLMWEALVGDPPVASTNYGECVQMHTGPDPWVLPISLQCPPGLEYILLKALAKPVEQRYPDCESMRLELLAWLNSNEAREKDGLPLATEHRALSAHQMEAMATARGGAAPQSFETRPAPPPVPDAPPSAHAALPPTTLPPVAPGILDVPAGPAGSLHPDPRAPGFTGAAMPAAHSTRRSLLRPGIGLVVALLASIALIFWALRPPSSLPAPEANTHETSGKPAPAPGGDLAPKATRADEQDDETPELPAYTAEQVWTAIQQDGWKIVGRIGTLDFDQVTQQNARLRKKSKSVAVTIYLTPSPADARGYLSIIEPPARAVRFGTTVVHVAPGSDGATDGVTEMMVPLSRLIARASTTP